jgi:prepilin-type N-terminal cleavage/methylation domain-containing protein
MAMSDVVSERYRGRIRSRRGGFTLGEVLVTVALVAVLAAVVLPAVGSQITKGDLGRVSSDLLTMRGAMEQFISDVRRYPNSVGQLTNKPAAATGTSGPLIANATCPSPAVFTTQYTAQEVARWRGPYLNKDSAAAIATGYSQSIRTCFDVQTPPASTISFETILISGIDATTAAALDAAMDDNSSSAGALQYAGGILKFFAIPIQP